MYVFLFIRFGSGDSGHFIKYIIANTEAEARFIYDLDSFWMLQSCLELRIPQETQILWDFEYFNPNYEG